MFWKKKKKYKKQSKDQPLTREQIIAQAQANARAAREEIGDETLDKIKEAMLKKENNPLEQAKRKVKAMDRQKVADSVSDWMREKD
ncbi:MAG: hypothetical protein AAF569_07055 [Pseudomonadota bacterium]